MYLSVYYALRNQFLAQPVTAFTLREAHSLWNSWDQPEAPTFWTEKALESLARESILVQTVKGGETAWQCRLPVP